MEMEKVKVEAYKLSNGLLVEDKVQAREMQSKINFEEAVSKFAEKMGTYETKKAIKDAIMEGEAELWEIFVKSLEEYQGMSIRDYYTY
jgi:hypothetical protein